MIPAIRRALTCAVTVGLLHGAGLAQAAQYRVSGVVQDGANGYLQSARVFFDVNGNGAYDKGEPSVVSNAQGSFDLKSNDPAASTWPVVAEVPVITPRGRDTRAVTAPFTLAAPAGHATVLNPQTTLVYARMVATGDTANEAAAHFGNQLGVSSILDYDYVAMKDSNAQAVAASLMNQAQTHSNSAVTFETRTATRLAPRTSSAGQSRARKIRAPSSGNAGSSCSHHTRG